MVRFTQDLRDKYGDSIVQVALALPIEDCLYQTLFQNLYDRRTQCIIQQGGTLITSDTLNHALDQNKDYLVVRNYMLEDEVDRLSLFYLLNHDGEKL